MLLSDYETVKYSSVSEVRHPPRDFLQGHWTYLGGPPDFEDGHSGQDPTPTHPLPSSGRPFPETVRVEDGVHVLLLLRRWTDGVRPVYEGRPESTLRSLSPPLPPHVQGTSGSVPSTAPPITSTLGTEPRTHGATDTSDQSWRNPGHKNRYFPSLERPIKSL